MNARVPTVVAAAKLNADQRRALVAMVGRTGLFYYCSKYM
jgi:hypothetical protein